MASRVAPARTPRAHVHRRDAAVSASCSAAPRRRVRSIAGCVGGRVGHPLAPGSRPGLSLEAESGARVGPLDACQLRATPTYRHRGRARLQSIGGCFALLTARSARSASSRARSALRSSPSADTGGARCRSSAVPSSFSVGRCTSGRCASVLRPVGTRIASRAGGRAGVERRTLERQGKRLAGCTLSEAWRDPELVRRRFREWVSEVSKVDGPPASPTYLPPVQR